MGQRWWWLVLDGVAVAGESSAEEEVIESSKYPWYEPLGRGGLGAPPEAEMLEAGMVAVGPFLLPRYDEDRRGVVRLLGAGAAPQPAAWGGQESEGV